MALAPVLDPGVSAAVLAEACADRTPRGIAAAVHRLIRSGALVVGDRLPTVRDLGRELGVSPATVSEAWQALAAVGAIQARGRAGTFVRESQEPTRPSRYLGIGSAPNTDGLDLSRGTPDARMLPSLREAMQRVIERGGSLTTSYLDEPVLPDLLVLLEASWPFVPERLTVVDGALDALSRVIDQSVRLGDRVVMEDPGFPPLIDLLERAGAEILPCPLDESGLIPAALEQLLVREPVALFLQPRAQNPTGISMTRERAVELATVLAPVRCLIVEDDHSGDIATGEDVSVGRFLPDRTVHIRSYSKSHGPDLRIAALGGTADVVDPLVARRMLGPGWTSRLLQAVLVELLTDQAAIAAVNNARTTYAMRGLAVRAGLAAAGVESTRGDGINTWVRVLDQRAALVSLAAQGIRVSPGEPFLIEQRPCGYLRVTTGVLDEDDGDHLSHVVEALVTAANAPPVVRGV